MTGLGGLRSRTDLNALFGAASPPPDAARPSLRGIERSYQVAEDRVVQWSPKLYGAVPLGRLGGSREITATEGRMLDRLTASQGFRGLQRLSSIADDAFATSDRRVPPAATMPPAVARKIEHLPAGERADVKRQWPRNDGHNDAFRHAYANARLTTEFGEAWTQQFTTAHEGSNPGSSTREAMDLYNNEVGRRIATRRPDASPAELADLIKGALDRGELVVIDRNGRLEWSDRVANGHHGVTIGLNRVRDAIPRPRGDASAQ